MTVWAQGKRTSVDIGAVMCTTHHDRFEALGWRCAMVDGRPWFIPPFWVDPLQRPMRNTLHDVLE